MITTHNQLRDIVYLSYLTEQGSSRRRIVARTSGSLPTITSAIDAFIAARQ